MVSCRDHLKTEVAYLFICLSIYRSSTYSRKNKGYRMVFASMWAVNLFLRAQTAVKFFLRTANTLENTDGPPARV